MRLTVVYNHPTVAVTGRPENLVTDQNLGLVAGLVADALTAAGHRVALVEADWGLLGACVDSRPDLIFNLAAGFAGTNAHEHLAACMFEVAKIPYTGADPTILLLTCDKLYTKDVLRGYGMPMARHKLLARVDDGIGDLGFPVILKPVREDGSLGIRYDSLVRSAAELPDRLRGLLETFRQPILAEEFIVGREFSVGVLGNEHPIALTPCEFKFSHSDPLRAFRSYEYKWLEEPEIMDPPSDADAEIVARIQSLAVKSHAILRCRDYSRADFRVADDGAVYFLEHNCNPDIGPNTHGMSNTMSRIAEISGMSFERLVETVIDIAARRWGISPG